MCVAQPSFDAVRDLPEAALRDLLAVGEPVERVWAAWALGLRRGGAAAPTLKRVAGAEPDAGTRRHLVVMLAGFGEQDAVAAMAMADPDPLVRATGCQYLERLAAAEPRLWQLVLGHFADAADVVRESLVLHLPADAPTALREAALACVSHDSLSVRQAVVGRLDTMIGSGSALPESVKRQALVEPSRDLRRQLLSAWREREGSASLLAAVARSRSDALTREALELAAEADPDLGWAAVAELADLGSEDIRRRIFGMFIDRLADVPMGWLVRYLAGPGGDWALAADVLRQLLQRFTDIQSLAPADQAALAAVARVAAEQLTGHEDMWNDLLLDEDGREWRVQLETLVREARRLCAGWLPESLEDR